MTLALSMCILWLILFVWTKSICEDREARLNYKINILVLPRPVWSSDWKAV